MARPWCTWLVWGTLGLAACDPAPAELPPPREPRETANGARVRHGAVQGFLARPLAGPPPLPAVLLLGPDLEPPSQQRALDLAEAGAVVLLVPPSVEPAAARSYLLGLPTTDPARHQTLCEREHCP